MQGGPLTTGTARRGPKHRSWLLGLAVALVLASACGDDDCVTDAGDTVAPGVVTDLSIVSLDSTSALLRWTAPGGDGLAGLAAAYDLRRSNQIRSEGGWLEALAIPTGAPREAGEAESLRLNGLEPESLYACALRARDEAGNWAQFSNTVVRPPAGAGRDLVPSVSRLDFGFLRIGEEVERSFRLHNLGSTTVAIDFLVTTPDYALPGGLGPFLLAPGDTLLVPVLFRPVAPGGRPGTIRIFPGASVTCRGTGADNIWSPHEALVPAGRYRIGTPPEEPGFYPGEIDHEVELTRAILVWNHEVVQQEWVRIMHWDASRPDGAFLPANNLTWFDAVEFCNRMSIRDGLFPAYAMTDVRRAGDHIVSAVVAWSPSANGHRLPTEAEWEVACRAGTATAFYSGEITVTGPGDCVTPDRRLEAVAWYCANSGGRPQEITQKAMNAYWLYDTLGNVSEWCWDWYLDYDGSFEIDPQGPSFGSDRVHRGGSFALAPVFCRGGSRAADRPGEPRMEIGLRLVRNAE